MTTHSNTTYNHNDNNTSNDNINDSSNDSKLVAIFYPFSQFCEIDIALLSS